MKCGPLWTVTSPVTSVRGSALVAAPSGPYSAVTPNAAPSTGSTSSRSPPVFPELLSTSASHPLAAITAADTVGLSV